MVKDIESCTKVLEAVQTLSEAAEYTMNLCRNGNAKFYEYVSLMKEMLGALGEPIKELEKQEPALTVDLMRQNAEYSLQNIYLMYRSNHGKAADKIEFELSPIICEMYVDIYFYGMIYPDKEKILKYYETDMPLLCPLSCEGQANEPGHYKYELSIVVAAYNHLSATKNCVKSVFQNIPDGLNYELILFNNGSSDGTKEFYESINPTKQVDFYKNVKSEWGTLCRIAEGKYIMVICNDVIMTPHSIENLLICIRSDDKIGMVAPTTPNISNLQTIPAEYQNIQELNAFAEKNNISDPNRWEERVRLCPPVYLFPSNNQFSNSLMDYGYIYEPHGLSFGDDKTGMLLRRNGFKNILCKDAYVHHIGSLTINQNSKVKNDGNRFYDEGRIRYKRIFDIDPWGPGFCYSLPLMQALNPRNEGHVDILGMNCGMGEDSLHIRELLKQNVHNTDVTLYNITDAKSFAPDLAGISDQFELLDSLRSFSTVFEGQLFDYIVMEDCLYRHSSPMKFVEDSYMRLKSGGKLAVSLFNMDITKLQSELSRKFGGQLIDGDYNTKWFIITK